MTSHLLLPVIILYNEDYHDSNIYKSLLYKYEDLHVFLYENSATPINQKYSSQYLHYFHNPENGGVTAGYNKGAEYGVKHLNAQFIVLFDQDTRFEDDYLEKLTLEISRNTYDLYTPVIMTEDKKPCSPVHVSRISIRGVNVKPGVTLLSKYKPINSGACVRLSSFLDAGGYNENIKLDFADFDFFERLNKFVSHYIIVDSRAYQSFSNEEKNPQKLFDRYKIYIQDARHFHNSHCLWPIVLRHTLALTLRTKRLQYISFFISKYILNV